MRKILVVQTWGIGDMVMTTPMLRALRSGLPSAHVTVVAGSPAAAAVIQGSDLCHEVRIMSFRNSSILEILSFFTKLRSECFDAALVASRLSPRIAFLLRFLATIKVVAGDGAGKRGWGYTHWRPVKPSNHRIVENLEILRLAFPGAGMHEPPAVHFHLDECSESEVERTWILRGLNGHRVLGMHPGCGLYEQDKKIPEEWCWKIIRKFLATFPKGKVLLFFGPEDSDFASEPRDALSRVVKVQNMPLKFVASLMAKTNAFLCGDTGLGHVAAAVGVPVVTVAGPTKIEQTRPWGGGNLIVRTEYSLPCMPCYDTPLYARCPISQKCITTVSVEAAFAAIAQIMKSSEA